MYQNSDKDSIFNIIIGSWGSYNACNERAYGSEWLNLADFSDWEEIEEELKAEGFELDGIDEELFVQDTNGLPVDDCDNTHPKDLFETLQDSGVMENDSKEELMLKFVEATSWREFEERVKDEGSGWCDDVYYHEADSLYELGELLYSMDYWGCERIPDDLINYIDWEAVGRDMSIDMGLYEIKGGWLEIR